MRGCVGWGGCCWWTLVVGSLPIGGTPKQATRQRFEVSRDGSRSRPGWRPPAAPLSSDAGNSAADRARREHPASGEAGTFRGVRRTVVSSWAVGGSCGQVREALTELELPWTRTVSSAPCARLGYPSMEEEEELEGRADSRFSRSNKGGGVSRLPHPHAHPPAPPQRESDPPSPATP